MSQITRAFLVNYACYPVSLGGGITEISPDCVGKMREVVEAEMAAGICIFLTDAHAQVLGLCDIVEPMLPMMQIILYAKKARPLPSLRITSRAA